MAPPTTIVFGASGNVGSVAARTAQQLGAKVVVASRDPQKPIKGLSLEDEKNSGFQRVQADLSQPDTIEAAVRATGAKRAFLYLLHGSPDHMRSAVEALKASGIEFVVFLSSIGVQGDIRSVPTTAPIPYLHAQAEIVLEEVYGPGGYLAVRPGWFNTNAVGFWSGMLRAGDVKMAYGDAVWDWISPDDIGKACGAILAQGPPDGPTQRSLFLCGPKLISQRDAALIFARGLGTDVKVTELDEEAAAEALSTAGVPPFVVELLTRAIGRRVRGDSSSGDEVYGNAYEEGAANLRKFVGNPTTLEEWTEKNKSLFAA